jgi:hypothetical protein
MPSKSAQTVLRDIEHHIELAEQFVAGFNQTSFKDDLRTVYAVTRCLEIISEASPNSRRHEGPPSKSVNVAIGTTVVQAWLGCFCTTQKVLPSGSARTL